MADPGIVQAIGLPFDEAIGHFEGKVLNAASGNHASWAETYGEAHARAFTVAGAASEALLHDFQTEIAKAIRNGTTLADFRERFDEIVKKHGWQQRHEPGWRAKVIYETNMATAHAAGRYAQMTDPDVLEAYPYWRYVHSGSNHPRLQHFNWNGLTLAASDGWWDVHYPPNGWRCGCRVRPVSGPALRRSGRDGPDRAPDSTFRPWKNPATGEVHMIPNGIDPGWDYNVGKAWKQGAPPPVAPPKPAPVVPPVAPPHPKAEPPTAKAPAPVTAATRRRAAPPLVAPGDPVTVAADFRDWADTLLKTRRPDGSVCVVGEIPDAAMTWLRARGTEPVSPALSITAAQLLHIARDAKQLAGKGLSLADIRRMPELLGSARAVLRERSTGNLLFVTDIAAADGRVARMVVTLDMDAAVREGAGRRRARLNAVKSASVIDPTELRSAARFELIDGEV